MLKSIIPAPGKWRVFSIESGPDFGGYHITEGPMSWEDIDTRGDLGKAHMADWDTNIATLLTQTGSSMYSVYREDLSSVPLTEFSNKIAINHVYIKPGYFEDVENLLKPFKKTWEASGQTVAVYEASHPANHNLLL